MNNINFLWEVRFIQNNIDKHYKYYNDRKEMIKDLIQREFPELDLSEGFYIQPLERDPMEIQSYPSGKVIFIS